MEVVFGLFRVGAWPVFALPAHRETELRHFAELTDAVAIVTVDRHEKHDDQPDICGGHQNFSGLIIAYSR